MLELGNLKGVTDGAYSILVPGSKFSVGVPRGLPDVIVLPSLIQRCHRCAETRFTSGSGCSSPFVQLAEHLTFRFALGASNQCLPGRLKSDVSPPPAL